MTECEHCGAPGATWGQTARATLENPAEFEATCERCANGAAEQRDAWEAALEEHADAQREERRWERKDD